MRPPDVEVKIELVFEGYTIFAEALVITKRQSIVDDSLAIQKVIIEGDVKIQFFDGGQIYTGSATLKDLSDGLKKSITDQAEKNAWEKLGVVWLQA